MQKQDSTLTETTQVVTKSSQAPPCCATKTNTSIGEGPAKAGDTVQSDESKLKTVAVLPKSEGCTETSVKAATISSANMVTREPSTPAPSSVPADSQK
ncbi:unnamed protein product [Nippostrongylus brasiliensis]|uniref:Uncharacterized protein n=1 Tax=Nippostrongylus brasiliensis TaxID=27835 RepID=A0A0N4XYB4_NIPBR|nr:unnamed protein product [Nippostrongylus brasiliensis]